MGQREYHITMSFAYRKYESAKIIAVFYLKAEQIMFMNSPVVQESFVNVPLDHPVSKSCLSILHPTAHK
jgi:hypothetical protein